MPKLSERDRLAELEARQRKVIDDIAEARRALRTRYADIVRDVAVETLSEREFREGLNQLVRVGGEAAIASLKALPTAGVDDLPKPL